MNTSQQSTEIFSLLKSGPFYQLQVKLKLDKKPWHAILFFLLITWLPLVIITGFENTLFGEASSFLCDIPMQVKFLLALPMLIIIVQTIDEKLGIVINYLSGVLMTKEVRENDLPPLLRWTKKMSNSVWPEIALILFILSTLFFARGGFYGGVENKGNTWDLFSSDNTVNLSMAGKWAVYFSVPVFQFILFRWLWKYLLWVILLFRISRLKLSLQIIHPDHAGGLGIILLAQKYFILVFVAASTVISGELVQQLLLTPDAFHEIKSVGLGYIALSLLLVLFPVIFFADKLMHAKHVAEIRHSQFGMELSRKFENDWVNDRPINQRVEEKQVEPSTLQDYSGIYRGVENLKLFPVGFRDIIGMVIVLIIPYLPIPIIHNSVLEMLQKIIGLLGFH